MNTQVHKISENESCAANSQHVVQTESKPSFKFTDNRPKSIIQQKIQQTAKDSPRLQQSAIQYTETSKNSSQEARGFNRYITDNRPKLKAQNRLTLKVAQLTKEDRKRRATNKVTKKFENLSPEKKDEAIEKMKKAKAHRLAHNKEIRERRKAAQKTKETQTEEHLKSGSGTSFSEYKESILKKLQHLETQIEVFEKMAKETKFESEEKATQTFKTWLKSLESMKKNIVQEQDGKKFTYGSADLSHRIEGLLSPSGVLKFSVLSQDLSEEDAKRIKKTKKGEKLPDKTNKESGTAGKYDRRRAGLRMGISSESGLGLFARMMAAFGQEVKSIRTEWGFKLGGNYKSYTDALEQNGGDKIDAAKKTWTYKAASMYGLSHVKPADNIDGNVSFLFEKEPPSSAQQ